MVNTYDRLLQQHACMVLTETQDRQILVFAAPRADSQNPAAYVSLSSCSLVKEQSTRKVQGEEHSPEYSKLKKKMIACEQPAEPRHFLPL